MIRCEDCRYQIVHQHKDRRYKDGGYNLYWCELCEDPFVGHPVTGQPGQFCSSAEEKPATEELPCTSCDM